MCGIAGILSEDGGPIDADRLETLRRMLANRGPNGNAIRTYDGIGLVSTRLAMVDEEGSSQPIESRDGRWVLIGNGEIYNHRRLRDFVRPSGYEFTTGGDLEVAIPLLAQRGPDGLKHLRGPFALALWDRLRRRLWLTRDRWGERPLFIARDAGSLHFASTTRALVAIASGRPAIDRAALASFIGTGLQSAGKSLLREVASIPPGTAVEIGPRSTRYHQYFAWEARKDSRSASPDDHLDEFTELLDRAIDRCLRTCRPLALAFSGGFDSTAILARARERADLRVLTLVTARPGVHDENRVRAARVARYLDITHEEIPWAIPTVPVCVEILGSRMDGPPPDPIVLHNDALSREVAARCPAVLAGHGADEVLAGYGRYRKAASLFPLATRSGQADAPGAAPLPFHPRFEEWPRMSVLARWLELAPKMLQDYPSVRDQLPDLLAEVMRESSRLGSGDAVNRMQFVDFLVLDAHENFVLPDEIGMAYGVEQRCPYLDHDLVEYAFSCPRELRVDNVSGKVLLRRYLERMLPTQLIDMSKIGFENAFGYDNWLLESRSLLVQTILDGPLPGMRLFRPSLWNRLRDNPSFFQERSALAWRAFAASAWIESHAGANEVSSV
jgi:asparagine synthase (glutamine-hydrolysing)